VGFRYFAKRQADELKINGWVRNLPDGTVEINAKGSSEALEQFMQRLKTGPIGSHVDQVQAQWLEAPGDSKGFEIIG
jgi:acylphosphatase